MSEADQSGAAANSGGPVGLVCKNCGEPVKRCAAFCNRGGWFHPDRLARAIRRRG